MTIPRALLSQNQLSCTSSPADQKDPLRSVLSPGRRTIDGLQGDANIRTTGYLFIVQLYLDIPPRRYYNLIDRDVGLLGTATRNYCLTHLDFTRRTRPLRIPSLEESSEMLSSCELEFFAKINSDH